MRNSKVIYDAAETLGREIRAAGGLPEGWTESRPGALACNPDPVRGGIVDSVMLSNPPEWFVIFNREDLPMIEGLTSRAEAFEKFFAIIGR